MKKFYKLKEDTKEFKINKFYYENNDTFMKDQNLILGKFLGVDPSELKNNVARYYCDPYGITEEAYNLLQMDKEEKDKMFKFKTSWIDDRNIFEFKKTKKYKEFIKEYQKLDSFENIKKYYQNLVFWGNGKREKTSTKNFVIFKTEGEIYPECKGLLEEIKESEHLRILQEFEENRNK